MRELITRQLHRHLKAVSVQVTEVIHTCRKDTHLQGAKEIQAKKSLIMYTISREDKCLNFSISFI